MYFNIFINFYQILDPTPRWPSSRDSPEFRPYNSLPRGQDVSEYPSLKQIANKSSPATPKESNNKLLEESKDTDESDRTLSKQEKESEIGNIRQRRVSLFERTLSELYDNGGKRSKRITASDKSVDQKKISNDKAEVNENKKNNDLKPSKIPSPRRKMHTTRSDTAAIVSKREPIKKFSSLQSTKKISIEKIHEKHVSFEQVETEITAKQNSFKSGIPRRGSKSDKKDDKKDTRSITDGSISAEETDISQASEINFIQEAGDDGTEVEQFSGAVFRKVTIRRRKDFKKAEAFDEGKLY